MKSKIGFFYLVIALSPIFQLGCTRDNQEPSVQSTPVYYSEWFTSSSWSGVPGDWYFEATAPDLTQDIVENGVVLAYCWLAGDLYDGSTIRILPAYAVGANWSFLIHTYKTIEFTCDMNTRPSSLNRFRFIAISGTTTALKSKSLNSRNAIDLKNMTYKDVCKLLNIPE